jgi:hypothetical protein
VLTPKECREIEQGNRAKGKTQKGPGSSPERARRGQNSDFLKKNRALSEILLQESLPLEIVHPINFFTTGELRARSLATA